jgi:hypothetical protein
MIIGTLSSDNDTSTPKKKENTTQAASKKEMDKQPVRSGNFTYEGTNYTYTFTSKDTDSTNTVVLQPFLPAHNDGALVYASLQLIEKVYGENSLVDPTPHLVNLNGIGYITFQGKSWKNYVTILKEDTGEINSISFFSGS